MTEKTNIGDRDETHLDDDGSSTVRSSSSDDTLSTIATPHDDNQASTIEKGLSTITKEAPETPLDGGYGWICTACVCMINAHTWGLNSSFGVFLAHYLANDTFPGASHLQYAFVGSLSLGATLGVSPLATAAVRKYGTKPTLMFGIVLQTASLILASFASKYWQLLLTQGLLFGIGMGFIFVPSAGIVPQWFNERRSMANGLSACGSGLGGVIYSFATGAMIQNLGLAWTFRILGILAFVANALSTMLLKDRNDALGTRGSSFDVSLLKRAEYLLLLGFGWFSMLAYVVLIFSISAYANEIGLNSSQAALISGIFNVGQTFGRPIIGFFSDKTGRLNMACFTTFLAGVFCLVVWVNAKSYSILVFFSVIGGFVGGTYWAVIAPITAEIVDMKDVPSALNIQWLAILLPCLFSEPMGLQIFVGTGNYVGTQLFVGFMYIAAALCLAVLRGWKLGEIGEIARVTNQEPEDIDPVKTENLRDDVISVKSKRVGRRTMLVECWRWGKV